MVQTLYKNTNNTNTIDIVIDIDIDIEVSFVRGFQPPTILRWPPKGGERKNYGENSQQRCSKILSG